MGKTINVILDVGMALCGEKYTQTLKCSSLCEYEYLMGCNAEMLFNIALNIDRCMKTSTRLFTLYTLINYISDLLSIHI